MPSLWFVMPAHGRHRLTAICLRQLRNTCDQLADHDIEASAVVIAEDGNLDTARDLGFGTIEQTNDLLGRRFNDGYQLATDPDYNPRPVDYVVPIGSDDWIDHRILLDLPDQNTINCFRKGTIVREDGRSMALLDLTYEGGIGIRVIPRSLVERANHRPAEDYKTRAVDTSTLRGLRRATPGLRLRYRDTHPHQIVDWKTGGPQLNPYRSCLPYARRGGERPDPFLELADTFPADALDEMRAVYGVRQEVAA